MMCIILPWIYSLDFLTYFKDCDDHMTICVSGMTLTKLYKTIIIFLFNHPKESTI